MAIKGDYFDGYEVMSAWEREHYLNRRLSWTIKHAYKHASAAADVLDKETKTVRLQGEAAVIEYIQNTEGYYQALRDVVGRV